MTTGREYLASILAAVSKIQDWDDAKLDQYAVDLEEIDTQLSSVADDDAIVLTEHEEPLVGVKTVDLVGESPSEAANFQIHQTVTSGASGD